MSAAVKKNIGKGYVGILKLYDWATEIADLRRTGLIIATAEYKVKVQFGIDGPTGWVLRSSLRMATPDEIYYKQSREKFPYKRTKGTNQVKQTKEEPMLQNIKRSITAGELAELVLIFHKGVPLTPEDYDRWAKLTNDTVVCSKALGNVARAMLGNPDTVTKGRKNYINPLIRWTKYEPNLRIGDSFSIRGEMTIAGILLHTETVNIDAPQIVEGDYVEWDGEEGPPQVKRGRVLSIYEDKDHNPYVKTAWVRYYSEFEMVDTKLLRRITLPQQIADIEENSDGKADA